MADTRRTSKKRDAILAAIRSTNCHPSAEWVYQTLKPVHPDLSLGTVYRNLVHFREAGLIQSIGVVQRQERFDGVTTPHSHFICDCCGTVLDLPDIGPTEEQTRSVSMQYGLEVSRHELTLHGRCRNCMQNISEEETTA